MTDFHPGSTYSGFVLQRMEYIREIDSTVYLFTHERLASPVFAIKNDDPNKTFCIAFQTIPEDSTGVAHILEHSVLMGSKKYPVNDVFGQINKGGLMTFLNAMTGSDTTWYPFATRNLKEYFNIMDVYLDVTLHPLLLKTTFEQEGWHYHKESADSPLAYQGVVFNEMKGAFSDPIRSIFHHTFSGLMPGSTYAHESGGDPQHIPDLSYDEFVDFHKRHYHPSNSTIFFYGDAPLLDELAYVEEHFFTDYQTPGERATIQQGEVPTEPVFIEDKYSVQPGTELDAKTFLAVGSTVGTVVDRERCTAFQIIANILFNSDASPLKRAILEAGLCKDFGGLFLGNSSFKTVMMTYLVGSNADQRDRFLDVYQTALQTMIAGGIESDLVLSELNKYEFSAREEMNKAQRGLDLISKALPALKYGTDPFAALQIEELFAGIRKKAIEDGYFEHLIREDLLENKATVVVTLTPDPDKMHRSLEQEKQRLADHEHLLNSSGQEELIQRTLTLLQLQQETLDETTLRLLPRLQLDDLAPSIDFHSTTSSQLANCPYLISDLDTNAILYLECGFSCSPVPAELLPYLDLFGTIVTEIGTEEKNYMQFAKEINIYMGGFSHNFSTYTHLDTPASAPLPMLWFQVKTLSTYLEQAVSLLREVFAGVDFSDRQRIREIVRREFAWAEHSVQSEGYNLASSRAFASLGLSGMYNEHVNGLTAYLTLKELDTNYASNEKSFLGKLEQLRTLIFRRQLLTLSVTARQGDIDRFSSIAPDLVADLSSAEIKEEAPSFPTYPANEAFCTSAEIVYNVQAANLFQSKGLYNGHFEVLKNWLSRDYLWNTVRQLGGAYGCFIQFNHITGSFGLVSYRDPQIEKTYEAYEAIEDQIQRIQLSEEALHQLIIGTYGNLDPHQGPAALGLTARNEYLSGITSEFKQKRIMDVLTTSEEDMRKLSPLFHSLQNASFRVTIGNGQKIKATKGFFDVITEI